ncbi:MAG: TraB/GumN family protein [Xanthomonadales bacterium]|nr:TraB/GumN family protein [Xanthomonadales bacterium]
MPLQTVRRTLLAITWALVGLVPTAPAWTSDTAADDGETVLATVLVTGDQPGPGLWRVRNGDHSLWLLGTVSPLPRRMRWMSDEVEGRIALSQVVIFPPTMNFDSGMGRVRGLFLLPSLLKARNNPEGVLLSDLLPAPLYARWQALKARHMPNNRSAERWRPLFAGDRLYAEAIKGEGLRAGGVVGPVVVRAARRHDVPVERPSVKIRIDDPRELLRRFSRTALDDTNCLDLLMARLEQDLDKMRERANAWAVGDLQRLKALAGVEVGRACIDAVLQSTVAAELGMEDLPGRLRTAWLDTVDSALSTHVSSFGIMPIEFLLGDDGVLATLAARGYLVESPDEERAAGDPVETDMQPE